jgi:mannose-6-phosphate isomerase class I
MKEILFIEPVFKSMIWGGSRLRTQFGYDIPDERTGECWAISAHRNGDCIIREGTYKGRHLSWLWENHRELFGGLEGDAFPLLVKLIDANKDLSIQVHPGDDYAFRKENGSLGKTECWYILDCQEDGTIVIGHNAKDKDELKRMIKEERWQELIRVRPVRKGDFFQITPGTVHAIKEGTLLLETQQSSDVTYRLYDYNRLDNGKPRPLHIDKSIDVIRCPHEDVPAGKRAWSEGSLNMEELISCRYYTVLKGALDGDCTLVQDKPFMNVSIISGEGTIDENKIRKGEHFILPNGYREFKLSGSMEFIISHV